DEISFYSVNGSLMYSFGHLIYDQPQGWFDPFVGVGVGSTWLKSEAAFTGNAEVGINFWLTDHFGLVISSTYRGALNHNATDHSHFQQMAGIKFAFGGKDSD